METTIRPNFWWLKSAPATPVQAVEKDKNLSAPRLNLRTSTSLVDLLQKETADSDVDVGSIIEEINRVAAQSPLGPYDKTVGDRSVDDLMKEAEKIYLESSKSFEQLSQRSKTSQDLSDLPSKESTPTPRSLSPLPMDHSEDEYTEDFSEESKLATTPPHAEISNPISKSKSLATLKDSQSGQDRSRGFGLVEDSAKCHKDGKFEVQYEQVKAELELRNSLIITLEDNNRSLRSDMEEVKLQLQKTNALLEQTKADLNAKSTSSPELRNALERLKDSKEQNTALQLQLDVANRSQHNLKTSYEDLLSSARALERRLGDVDATLLKYKDEIIDLQSAKDKLQENETNLKKLLEIEKLQSKSSKLQNEKDARCIQDLNRQIKEMERIIARKHPDSVSALIVAAKENATDTNVTARKVLEDRIKCLEREQLHRDAQSSGVFSEIQDKFNQMKAKYENHIEDLETHVNDLKGQLKRKVDTFDVYTQTGSEEKVARKENGTQTGSLSSKPPKTLQTKKLLESTKEDAHLLATIRGLQTDLANKEKVIVRLQKEVEDARKTNRRLQKEREGSLKNLLDKKEFRSYPEKLSAQTRSDSADSDKDDEVQLLKRQIARLEEDFRALKTKRIQDLTALQEAHERELAGYLSSVTPLREQLELQRASVATLQSQLGSARAELAATGGGGDNDAAAPSLLKKIAFLEKRYDERETRLRAIAHGLAQKSATNRGCEECAERQLQLVGYKAELDQLLATVRALR